MPASRKTMLLAGCGHAHIQVLLRQIRDQVFNNTTIVVVSPYSRLIYSGMLPGWLAGHYSESEITADIEPIVHAAGACWVQDEIVQINAQAKQIITRNHGSFNFDLLSLNLGADIKRPVGTELIALDRVLPLRPIEHFLSHYPAWSGNFRTLHVIGGGAAGAEVAASIQYAGKHHIRWWAGANPLGNYTQRLRRSVIQQLTQMGVDVRLEPWTPSGDEAGVGIVMATGSQTIIPTTAHDLAVDAGGFFSVDDTLAVLGQYQQVFAVGDCASAHVQMPHGAVWVRPKSGVTAVRDGRFLADQLTLAINQQPLAVGQPQKYALNLLAMGKKSAIASWAGFTLSARWAWRLKHHIDTNFMKTLRQKPNEVLSNQ